jgi:hypothetical protein
MDIINNIRKAILKILKGRKKMAKGGMWHLNYQIKTGVGKPEDKFEVNVNRTKKGIHVVANAGIPELSEEQADALAAKMKEWEVAMDDKNAESVEEHVKCLKMVADYCNYVASMIENA